jgi:hypothetical protein
MVDRLGECVVPSQHALETEAGPHPRPLSLQGRLAHFQRQHAEDMAPWVDVERPVIPDGIGPAPWDYRPLVTGYHLKNSGLKTPALTGGHDKGKLA